MATKTQTLIAQNDKYGTKNYLPLPIVIGQAKGIWVEDPEGKRYMDMLSAYSAVNQGHCHDKIVDALVAQAKRATLTSRAFHNDQLAPWSEKICTLAKKERVLPMNTGAEAVETALKAARRWGYTKKGIKADKAQIIVCNDNFHGRTLGAISLSSEEEYKRGFGPLLEGVVRVPYGDLEALKNAIAPNTAAFLVEPIQGEAGIKIPPQGYLEAAWRLCKDNNVLFIADEVQAGLGRTGKLFACDHEGVTPDMYILGKALGGGVLPISCVLADSDVLDVFDPGSHGSTFGGNPLACAVSMAALDVLTNDGLIENSAALGAYFLDELKKIHNPKIKDVRGRGLFIGVELSEAARPYCERLKDLGILCKETHDTVIRFAPPLIITKDELDEALTKIRQVLQS